MVKPRANKRQNQLQSCQGLSERMVERYCSTKRQKEVNDLFNDALNPFYLRLYGVKHILKDLLVREETYCFYFMDYSFEMAARDILYALSYR